MTPTPHSQRCETCGHYDYMKCTGCQIIRKEWPTSLQIGIPFFINILGCCSYMPATVRGIENPPSDAVTLTPALTAHYAALSAETGKPVSELVARDLEEYQEYRRWLVNEAERL